MEATRLKPQPVLNRTSAQAPQSGVDWSQCTLVEVNLRKVSGAPILKGTRVQADSIVENYEGGSSVQEISENFSIPEPTIHALLAFAGKK